MNFIHPSVWIPANKIELEKSALEAVTAKLNTLVFAGPGAGKTELLAQRACFLLQTNTCQYPKKILAISFKKDASKNLEERVERRCGDTLARRFVSKTFDAFAKDLLDRFCNALPEKFRLNPNYNIAINDDLQRAFKYTGYIPPNVRGFKWEKVYSRLVNHPLPMQISDGIDIQAEQVWDILLKGKHGFDSCISFPMISRLAELLIRNNPLLQSALRQTYSHVFLDEFQDTTDIQYDLLKTCFCGSNLITTAVGDTKQRIMLWARAKKTIFPEYCLDFGATQINLFINHRSAPRLVELQKLFYKSLNEQAVNIQTSTKWCEADGIAELWMFNTAQQEAKLIAAEINRLCLEESLKKNEILIVVKQLVDSYAPLLINELQFYGIRARNENVFQDLLKEECILICIYILLLSISRNSADAWLYVTNVMKMVKSYDENTSNEKIYDMQKEISVFLYGINKKLKITRSQEELTAILWTMINLFGIDRLKAIYPQYCRGTYLDTKIKEMSQYLWLEFLQCNDWSQAVSGFLGIDSIPIMTIHKSKGLEYDTVIFIGLEDSAFWNFSTQTEEDTCSFFVALSRAKRRVIFTFSRHRELRYSSCQGNTAIGELYRVLGESGVVELKDYRK